MRLRSRSLEPIRTTRQRGVVVIVALMAVVMMALSAAALLRSAEATTTITGNIGAMRAAQAALDGGVERAVDALFETHRVANPDVDDVSQGYSSTLAPGENVRGVPFLLQVPANYPRGAPAIDVGEGAVVRYVIERMCLSAGPPTRETCVLAPAGDVPLAPPGVPAVEPAWVPVYRQTVRVDGPGAASAIAQVWLADIPGRRRVAWRALGY